MRTTVLLSSFSIAFAVACGSGHHAASTAPAPTPASGASAEADRCPMHVSGTHVVAADTDAGVTITFTTRGDVAELRARVRDMAAMHEHMAGGEGDHDMGAMKDMPPPSHATSGDVDGGEQVTLTPVDPAQRDALRAAIRHHVEMMQGGDCPMMHEMKPMGGAPPPSGS